MSWLCPVVIGDDEADRHTVIVMIPVLSQMMNNVKMMQDGLTRFRNVK